MHFSSMEIAFACKLIVAADDDTETNPMSLENVAKEREVYGKSKRKTLSFFYRHCCCCRIFPIRNIVWNCSLDNETQMLLIVRNVQSSATSDARPSSIVGLFTQHQTFTFSQQPQQKQQLVLHITDEALAFCTTLDADVEIAEHRSHWLPQAFVWCLISR